MLELTKNKYLNGKPGPFYPVHKFVANKGLGSFCNYNPGRLQYFHCDFLGKNNTRLVVSGESARIMSTRLIKVRQLNFISLKFEERRGNFPCVWK